MLLPFDVVFVVVIVVVSSGVESTAVEYEKLLCCAMNNAENLQIFEERFFFLLNFVRIHPLVYMCMCAIKTSSNQYSHKF